MANHQNRIPLPVIKRLPRYYRYVRKLAKNGVTTISSSELASLLGTTASQVRQDFNCFGGFGQQGVGYNVALLLDELEKLLFSGNQLTAILIGVGRLGRTVSSFVTNEAQGYKLVAAFDKDPREIGRMLGNLEVRDVVTLADFCKQNRPQVAVLCVPEEGATRLVPQLLELGVTGFWNFSHYDLGSAGPGVVVENVHLGDSLASLGYQVRHQAAE